MTASGCNMKKCLDTYALVEIHDGNPKFLYLLTDNIVITDITMAEFYGVLYNRFDKLTADYWYRKFQTSCAAVSQEILIHASMMKVDMKKQNISFIDCVGYTFAKENNCSFVTGDKEFEHMKGVEFIKK